MAAIAYAEVEDVLARAGVLAKAWDDSTTPGYAEIESFLRTTAAEINAGIGARGFGVPVDDPVAAPALAGYNADKALLLALDATWPGSSARDDVADLRASILARVTLLDAALASGDLPAILVLAAEQSAETIGGAASFWDTDAPTYSWWLERVQTWATWDPSGASLPEFYRGMSF